MRVLSKQQCLLLVFGIILTTYTLSTNASPAKDKKKLLDKLRSALNQTEIEEVETLTVEVPAENVTADVLPEAKSVDDETFEKSEEGVEISQEEKSDETEKSSSTEVQKVDTTPVSYLLKMKTILRRIFDMFGFRQSKKKEGRQHRMLTEESYSYNGLDYEYFRDDIRTTVGAVLGQKECIQKIVCGAGSYLRSVNGKNVILTILENVTPTAWVDTMELLKQSAVTNGECQYKCLEEDEEA